MTIDDNSSIYIGGIPYDVGEDRLRRVFDIYGSILAVKIINDRPTGGKCYGFITFANPRSAIQAINEMDGKTIHGRVVKVNEVRTKGRPNFNRESSRRDSERGIDDDGGKYRGRDANYDRHYHRDGHRERSQGYDRESERGYDHEKDRYVDEDRFRRHNRPISDAQQGGQRKRERDWERDSDINIEEQWDNSHHKSRDKDEHYLNRSTFDDRENREHSLESLNDDQDQAESTVAVSNQKLEELRKDISQIEDWTADKEEEVSQLQEKYQKLEDSLKAAKRLTSHRHMQLEKLHKSYLQVRDYDKRFKNAEGELQSLVDATTKELEMEGA